MGKINFYYHWGYRIYGSGNCAGFGRFFFVIRAALEAYVEKAYFTSKALEFISSYLGDLTMGAVAEVLALYGIFNFVKARFYKVTIY